MKILNKSRIWIIITVAILVVGLTLLTIFGFNNGVDFKNTFEVKITASEGINNVTDTIEVSSTEYFAENGISYSSYATQVTESGVIYKFSYKPTELNVTKLQEYVANAVEEIEGLAGIEISVEGPYQTAVYYPTNVWFLILTIVLSLIAIFAYLCFMEKVAGAISVVATSILSTIVYTAFLALTRIPVLPYYLATLISTFIITAVISVVIVNRCRELRKNVGNDKLADIQVSDKATVSSLFRVAFMLGALVLSGLALLIVGNGYLRFLGLQLIALALTSAFVSLAFTGTIWAFFNKGKKKEYIEPETESK